MPARTVAQRALRPITARLDGLARRLDALATARAGDAAALAELLARQTALVETLRARDGHFERRTDDIAARLDARLETVGAELDALRQELAALRAAQADGLAYLGRRTATGRLHEDPLAAPDG